MAASTFMFDAYGTLFDVHSAVAKAGAALGPLADPVSQLWRTKQLEYSWTLTLMGGFEDFWELTGRGLDFALARHGVADPALRAGLMDAYLTLGAYPDVTPALGRLKAAARRTAIFTNGTRAMVDAAVAAAGIGPLLDHVVTVEACRAYKPLPAVYHHAMRVAGITDAADIVFVSSNRWDVAGAASVGMRAVWINRTGMPGEYPGRDPVAVLTGLDGLAELSA